MTRRHWRTDVLRHVVLRRSPFPPPQRAALSLTYQAERGSLYLRHEFAMSAFTPKADMCGALTNVCVGPIADIHFLFLCFISALMQAQHYRQISNQSEHKDEGRCQSPCPIHIFAEVGRIWFCRARSPAIDARNIQYRLAKSLQ